MEVVNLHINCMNQTGKSGLEQGVVCDSDCFLEQYALGGEHKYL